MRLIIFISMFMLLSCGGADDSTAESPDLIKSVSVSAHADYQTDDNKIVLTEVGEAVSDDEVFLCQVAINVTEITYQLIDESRLLLNDVELSKVSEYDGSETVNSQVEGLMGTWKFPAVEQASGVSYTIQAKLSPSSLTYVNTCSY